MKLSNKHIVHCGRCDTLEWSYTNAQLESMIAPFSYFKQANIDPDIHTEFILWDATGHTKDGEYGETALVEYCRQHKPFMVIISAQGVPIMFDDNEANFELHELGVKVVYQWGDSVEPVLRQRILNIAKEADLSIYLDDPLFEQQMPDKLLWMWSFPPLVKLEYVPPKDIEVSFAGSIQNYPDRQHYLRFLQQHNVPVVVCGGDTGTPPIGDIFHRSKISLNFSLVNRGTAHQLKSRTIEAPAAYSLLMESDNPLIKMMYEPYEEYVPFTTEQDLLDKIKYYLAHLDERDRIVRNAHRRLFSNYTPQQWWQRVFARLGVE